MKSCDIYTCFYQHSRFMQYIVNNDKTKNSRIKEKCSLLPNNPNLKKKKSLFLSGGVEPTGSFST